MIFTIPQILTPDQVEAINEVMEKEEVSVRSGRGISAGVSIRPGRF